MELRAAIDIIIKDLNEACEIIEDLKRYPGVPVFQVELVRSKCRSASEIISLLKELPATTGQESTIQPLRPEAEGMNQAVRDLPPLEISPGTPAEIPVVAPVINTVSNPVITPVEVNIVPAAEIQKEAAAEFKPVGKKTGDTTILADQFLNREVCYNENLGNTIRHDDDVSTILKTKPLTNLSDAIGINDKFLFIREIFNGNQETYTKAILRLDSVGNMADARAVIMSYTGDTSENEAVKQLLDLLKRKLQSNE